MPPLHGPTIRAPRWAVVALVGAVVVLAAGTLALLGRGKQPSVVVAVAVAAPVDSTPGGVGDVTLPPDANFALTAELLGATYPVQVTSVDVHVGEFVERGTVLVSLDSSELSDSVTEDKLQLAAARSALADVQGDISAGSVGTVEALQATVSLDQETLDLAEGNSTSIRSPVGGEIAQLEVGPGDVADPGRVLLNIANTSAVQVSAGVQLADMASVKAGDPARVTFEALPGVALDGTVEAITPNATNGGLDATVVVSAANDSGNPVPIGTRAYISIDARVDASVTVPLIAVSNLTLDPSVYVIADGRAERTAVVLGAVDDDRAQVVSGIEAGSTVALTDTQLISDGEKVNVAKVLRYDSRCQAC